MPSKYATRGNCTAGSNQEHRVTAPSQHTQRSSTSFYQQLHTRMASLRVVAGCARALRNPRVRTTALSSYLPEARFCLPGVRSLYRTATATAAAVVPTHGRHAIRFDRAGSFLDECLRRVRETEVPPSPVSARSSACCSQGLFPVWFAQYRNRAALM